MQSQDSCKAPLVLNLEPTCAPSPLPARAVERRRLRSAQLGPSDGTGAEGLAVAAGRLHLSDRCADSGSVLVMA